MLKWIKINQDLLTANKQNIFKYTDDNPVYEKIVKSLLGLEDDIELKDLKFELEVFGNLSECYFASRFQSEMDIVNTTLKSGKAEDASEAFNNKIYIDELLNLFDREDEEVPSLPMLQHFLKSQITDFQTIPDSLSKYWIAKWNDVNSWAFYWSDGSIFNCLAKMSA